MVLASLRFELGWVVEVRIKKDPIVEDPMLGSEFTDWMHLVGGFFYETLLRMLEFDISGAQP